MDQQTIMLEAALVEAKETIAALNEQAQCGDRQLIEMRQRVTVLESWAQKAVELMQQEYARRPFSYELHVMLKAAPIAQPEQPIRSGVRVHNYANDKGVSE